MEKDLLIIIMQGLIFGGFCAFSAHEKNRAPFVWFFLGLIFSFVALMSLIAIPQNQIADSSVDDDFQTRNNCNHEGENGYYCTKCGAELKKK